MDGADVLIGQMEHAFWQRRTGARPILLLSVEYSLVRGTRTLTAPAVIERARRIEELGIIRSYRGKIDPAKIGLPIAAFIRMSVVGDVFRRVVDLVQLAINGASCCRSYGRRKRWTSSSSARSKLNCCLHSKIRLVSPSKDRCRLRRSS